MSNLVRLSLAANVLAFILFEPAYCETCLNGKVWKECGTPCPLMCGSKHVGNYPEPCAAVCEEGCQCPDDMPWERADGSCAYTENECKNTSVSLCEGDLEWHSCGTSCPIMCSQGSDAFTVRCTKDCVPGCRCPFDKPWQIDGTSTCASVFEECPNTVEHVPNISGFEARLIVGVSGILMLVGAFTIIFISNKRKKTHLDRITDPKGGSIGSFSSKKQRSDHRADGCPAQTSSESDSEPHHVLSQV